MASSLVLVLLLLASAALSRRPNPASSPSPSPVSPNNLDPRYGTDENSARAHQLLFNDLLTLGRARCASRRASPESWETTDYQTYRVQLRQGVRFHDGHELTSADVVYTFTSMLDPGVRLAVARRVSRSRLGRRRSIRTPSTSC